MLIEEKTAGGSLVVKLQESRLDAHIAVNFKTRLSEYVDSGHKRIVLDLSAVEFIDSSGLGAIVSSLKRVGTDGELVICSLRDAPLSLFKLTRMDRVFNIYPTVEEAMSVAASA